MPKTKVDVGIVIGRFQVDDLHEGHRFLISTVLSNHRRVIVFIGLAPILGTSKEPLDFATRERMIRSAYPEVVVLPLRDCPTDEEWSSNIDSAIKTVYPDTTEAVLYGGRDSFVPHYLGRYKAVEIDSGVSYRSGSQQREDISKVVRGSSDFRAGVIYARVNTWPHLRTCVDICLWKVGEDGAAYVLLGRRKKATTWIFPGGMMDKEDESLEAAASRELFEETNVAPGRANFRYVGSGVVPDPRYSGCPEVGVSTAIFAVRHDGLSHPHAGSDLNDTRWFSLDEAFKEVAPFHRAILFKVKDYIMTTLSNSR